MKTAALFRLIPLVLLAACQGSATTKDLAILDVRPTKLQLGDKLIVEGKPVMAPSRRNRPFFVEPTFAAKAKTKVILEGRFIYPERRKRDEQARVEMRIELAAKPVPAAADPAWAERIIVRLDSAAKQRIGWARFRGRLGVEQQVEGQQPVTVWAEHVKLIFFRPTMRSLAQRVVGWVSHDRVLAWLGIETEPTEKGLRVSALKPGTSATVPAGLRSGIQQGDLLVRAGDRSLHNMEQLSQAFRTASRRGVVALSVMRGPRELTLRIPCKHKPLILPTSLIYLVVMLVFGLVVLTVALVTAGLLTWLERRVAGRVQSRVGPNRVGPQGIIQWLADGIKLLLKEDIIPEPVDRPLFKLAPYLVLTGLLGTFVVIPFAQFLIVSDLNVGLLYLIAITGLVALGLMMAGWSSNNKWALLGGMRSAAQIVSYEIPAALALMVPVILAGSLSTQTLVERQGGWPWQWHAFDNPFTFICFFIYFISALAEGNRTPFDLPEAESELVAGYQIEYSGWRFAVFMLSEWANIFVIGAIATTVFLGGWQVPGLHNSQQASSWIWQLVGLCIFWAKSLTLVFVIIWIRWTLPRFRVDQMMRLCWQYFVPWAFASLIIVAAWAWVAPPWLRKISQWGTFLACGCGLAALFFSRVLYNWRHNPEKFSWKPFY